MHLFIPVTYVHQEDMHELHDTVIYIQCIKQCISSYESKQIQNRKESKGCSLHSAVKHAALCTLA